jgi:hypothetical protein
MKTGAIAMAEGSRREPRRPIERRLAGEDRLRMIAEAAWYRAERRGFAPGRELEDWLAAEIEIDALFGGEEDRERSDDF